MKKLFLLALAITLVNSAFAFPAKGTQMEESIKEAISAHAHDKGVINVSFDIIAQFDEVYANINHLTKQCVAVRIADDYLLASLACKGVLSTGTKWTYAGSGTGYEPVEGTKIAFRKITGAKIAGEPIPVENIFEDADARLILIRLDINQEKLNNINLKQMLGNVPMPGLFIPNDPQSLLDTFPQVIVNRNRMPNVGRTCKNVSVKKVCSEEGCFKVCWKPISAQTGSPLFGLPDDSQEEFLLGFNAAEPDGENRTSGEVYYLLNSKTVPFLQKNMKPSAFKQLRIVNETDFE